MDIEERLDLIRREPSEEILTDEDLKKLLETKDHPIAYDGFEPSGRIHLGSGVMRAIKVQDLQDAGVKFTALLADWHAWINNKMGGDLELIKKTGDYFIEAWKACGIKNIDFVYASDLVKDPGYWKTVLDVSKITTIKRMVRAGTIMGRNEAEMQYTGQLFYPAMQATDPFYLKADICQLGMDQRSVTILSREIGKKIGFWDPVCVHHHLLMGLTGPTRMGKFDDKMSKSKENTAIFIHDTPDQVKQKISQAFCEPKDTQTNPILELWKYIILRKFKSRTISRPSKFGGDLEISDYKELESLYGSGKLHPADLKPATITAINEILEPIHKYFEKPGPKKLYEEVKAAKVTR